MSASLAAAFTDTAVRRATSGGAYIRGAEYARQGRVTQVSFDAETMGLSAVVRGSGNRSYSTAVQVRSGGASADVVEIAETWCSCPVGFGCKHAAALMLATRARFPPAGPAVEAQAVDRTHRIGQRRTVMVYQLVASDTIETKVMELKARKQRLFASVMDEGGQFGSALTADDIRGLLGG